VRPGRATGAVTIPGVTELEGLLTDVR
jgi:hypothetical protein